MRRARSQLNKLIQQQAGNNVGLNAPQSPYAIGGEVDEIQRRLDALQFQQAGMHASTAHLNDFAPNLGFPQPMPSSGVHQPVPQNQAFHQAVPNPAFQQPAINPYAAANMAVENPGLYGGNLNNTPKNTDAGNPQLDTIKSALEQMSSKLQSINNANAASSNNQNTALQQSEILKQHYNHINAELKELKASISGIASSDSSNAGLEVIQQTLSANYQAIMQQLERSQNSGIDGALFSSALEASHKELSQQIIDMKQSIDATLSNPNIYAKTLEVSHDDITKRLDDMHNALQTSITKPDLYVSTIENNHNEVLQQVSQLQQVIENLENGSTEATQTDLSSIEMRLEEITRAVVALSLNDGSNNNLERIEARVSDIAKTLDGFNESATQADNSKFDKLESKLSDIANLMHSSSPDLNSMEMQIGMLSEKLESFSSVSTPIPQDTQADNAQFDKLESKLSDIANLVHSSSPDLNSMEAQIGMLSEKLENFSSVSTAIPQDAQADNAKFDKLESKLSDIANLVHSSSPDLNNVEAQIGILSEKLENFSSISTAAPLSNDENNALLQRMDELVSQISNTQTQSNNDISNEMIAQQLEQISGAVDRLSMPVAMDVSNDNGINEVIIQQLEQIAGAIDQLSQPSAENMSAGQFASIEQQLSEISNQLVAAPSLGEVSLDPIANRLSGIEEQLGANRDITIELATKAAEDAVKMSFQAMPQPASGSSQLDTSVLGSMSELLAQLNQHAETNNATNIEAFGAVTQTLDLMVKRLGKIESDLVEYNSAPQAMPAQVIPAQVMPAQASAPDAPNIVQSTEEASIVQAEVEAPIESQEIVKKVRNPAADLVKAARLSAATEQNVSKPKKEPVVNTLVEQAPVDGNQSVEELVSQGGEETTLPEVETPAMAMESMPEIQHHNESEQEIDPDVALEPGTGGPDLAALVRQANDRRKNNKGTDIESSGTDFIAAARRAAQAAAQEAGAVEEEIEEKKSKSLFASLPELFAKRKKVIVMAAAAALFVALAVPLATQFFDGQNSEVASIDNNITIEKTVTEEAQQASVIPAQDTVSPVEIPSAETAIVDNTPVNSVSDIQSVNASGPELQESPKEVNLASVNLDENPTPTSFINTEGLSFAPSGLKDAVQKGEPAAIFEIGRRYTDGIGTKKDLKKASEWYELAAQMGFAPAQYIIGNFNEKGLGIEKNPATAAEWYEQAAKGGNIIAMHNLAVLTATPNALSAEPDMNEAFKWFSNAADYGVRDSQVNAGIFHTKGLGTEVNLIEAYKWFAIAAKAGDKDAGNKRDVIINAIQPDQLEIAKALVKDWQPLEVVKAANEVPVNEAWKSDQAVATAPKIKIDRNTIAQIQTLLSKVGFNAGAADGVMGQKTRNAIVAFQQKSGLPVNGRIDDKFLKALKAVAI